MVNNETDHLKRMGVKILKPNYDLWHGTDGIWKIRLDGAVRSFDPVHNLNHTEMVLDAMVEKGWSWQIGSTEDAQYCSVILRHLDHGMARGRAPIKQKGLAVMRTIAEAIKADEITK